MNIRSRLRLNAALSILLPVLVGLLLYLSYQNFTAESRQRQRAQEIRLSIGQLSNLLTDFVLHPGARVIHQWQTTSAQLSTSLANVTFTRPEETASLHRLRGVARENRQLFDNIISHIDDQQNHLTPLVDELTQHQVLQLSNQLQHMRDEILMITHSTEEHTSRMLQQFNFLTVLTVLGMAGTLAVLLLITERKLVPVLQEMQRGVRRVQEGDHDFRFHPLNHDELGALATAFDDMLDCRQASDQALHRLNRELKGRIARRTAELQQSVVQLGAEITQRSKTEQDLRRGEELYRVLVENLDLGVALIDADYRIQQFNRAYSRLFELPQDVGLGNICYQVLHDKETICDNCPGRKTLLSGTATEIEFCRINAQGNKRHQRIRAVPIFSDSEKNWFVDVIEDITERKNIELQLDVTLAELRRSNQELEQFAYVASHDLQEPLRMVSSYLRLIERRYRGQLDTDADEFIEFAVSGAKRMQGMITDLLAFSRIGRNNEAFTDVGGGALMESVRQNLQQALQETAATLTHDPLPVLYGNPGLLAQVLQNLIGNAIKFHGDAPPCVHVSARDEGESWLLSVRDNGIGIDPRFIDRLFVIFKRLPTKSPVPGTGIGLALVKKIVEQHGGRIWVESTQGEGSTFYFTLKKRSDHA